MIYIRTFGAIGVEDASGDLVAALDPQRRSLALLAALAVAGTRGMTRDKLLALLWPEADPERARHSLTQALYATRRLSGVDDLFATQGAIRLNLARAAADVLDFSRAVESGELETIAALYRGPFMDGFVLPGVPGFTQWVAEHRARFEEDALSALDHLASAAERRSDFSQAAAWLRKYVRLKPLDSGAVGRLMLCLAQAGDRAAAMAHAAAHEQSLKASLGLEPDAEFVKLVGSLPHLPGPAPVVSTRLPTAASPEATTIVSGPAPSHDDDLRSAWPTRFKDARSFVRATAAVFRRVDWRQIVVTVGLVLFAALGARDLVSPGLQSELRAHSGASAVVAVAPFTVRGADPGVSHLGLGLAELLAARLGEDSTNTVIEPGTVFKRWRVLNSAGLANRDSIIQFGAGLGATRVVIGSIVGTRSRALASVALVAVQSRQVIATAEVESSADSIRALADGLATKLLIDETGQDELLVASRRPRTLRGLRAFLAARNAMDRGEYATAASLFDATTRADSTFVQAALDMAMAAERLGDVDRTAEGIARVWAHRAELDKHSRDQLTSLVGPRFPQLSTAAEQLAAWEAPVREDARHAETWSSLAIHLLREGARLGSAAYLDRARTALQRATALSPDDAGARDLLLGLPLADDSATGTRPTNGRLDGEKQTSAFVQWRSALMNDDSTARRQVLESFPQLSRTSLRTIALFSEYNSRGLADGARALQVIAGRAKTVSEQVDVILAEHSFALNRGDVRRALAATVRLRDARPDSHGYLRLRILDAMYGGGDSTAAAHAAMELASPIDSTFINFPLAQSQAGADACVLAQWNLRHGDTVGVRAAVSRLRRIDYSQVRQIEAASPAACAELVDAALAVETRQRDARARVSRVDSLVFMPSVAGNAALYAHLTISRLYATLGDSTRARAAIAKRSYLSGWSPYVSSTWLEEARLAERVGDRSGASRALSRYMRFRAGSGSSN